MRSSGQVFIVLANSIYCLIAQKHILCLRIKDQGSRIKDQGSRIKDQGSRIKVVVIKHRPWPFVTLGRFATFLEYQDILQTDYLFFFNANLLPVSIISEEEFLPVGDLHLLATQAMGFYNLPRNRFTYERNPESCAYIPYDQGKYYFQGGLQGGRREAFLEACYQMNQAIEQDLARGIIAVWHDESHWNKYLLQRSDVKILSLAYLFPEEENIISAKIVPKILVLDKNNYGGHEFMRSNYRSLLWWRIKYLWIPTNLTAFLKFKLKSILRKIYYKIKT